MNGLSAARLAAAVNAVLPEWFPRGFLIDVPGETTTGTRDVRLSFFADGSFEAAEPGGYFSYGRYRAEVHVVEVEPGEGSGAPSAREAELLELIADLASEDVCRLDHHGYCHEHRWMTTAPACPHGRAKTLLEGVK